MNKALAPVILFVYNRPWHTRQVLESLKANVLASESKLYIFSDGPKIDAKLEDMNKIQEVRNLIREEKWCGEIEIIERFENLGLATSVIKGVTEVIHIHDRVIVLEDDIVTSKYFLKFMNKALEVYRKSEKVFGISGYKYPTINEVKEETFFLPISCSWSFATWKESWVKVNFNGNELLNKIELKHLKKKLDFGGNSFYNMLKDQIAGKNDSWAIRFYVSMFLEKAYFLYPNKSLVTNIGFDNSGVHCGLDNFYSKSLMTNQEIKVLKKKIKLNNKIINSTSNRFKTVFQKPQCRQSIINKLILKLKKKINYEY